MMRVGKFEKVSYGQFYNAMMSEFGTEWYNAMIELGRTPDEAAENINGIIQYAYDEIELPKRATSGSFGYDIHAPLGFVLEPGEGIKLPTGLRVKIDEGWGLLCAPRSGLGFKYRLRLANTIGVIDEDYYGSSNEGQVFIKVFNEGDKPIKANQGDSIVQAFFLPYGVTYDDDADGVRDGGFGSTGR